MILSRYSIEPSTIQGAGKGLFLQEPIKKGSIMVVPDAINRILTLDELNTYSKDSLEQDSSVRWFENYYTVNLEWTDECYINHSFECNGIWHLGFIFAARDIEAGEEMTIDYRFIIPEGEAMPFVDGTSGQAIIGYSWKEIMAKSMEQVQKALF